jgi:hypothetical protein
VIEDYLTVLVNLMSPNFQQVQAELLAFAEFLEQVGNDA